MNLETKEQKLIQLLQEMDSIVVAFSGGVDSAYLAYMANKVLGKRALAVTGLSASVPAYQREEAAQLAKRFNFDHKIINTDELDVPEYRNNPSNRCYFCKHELYTKLNHLANELNFRVIVDGTNVDDLGDFRPGRAAALQMGVRSPLVEAGMTKQDIRELSKKEGLPTWDKPASACLSSRFPYGTPITVEKLAMVEKGEDIVRGLGFKVFRVRYHNELVRLEFAKEELPRALNIDMADRLLQEFKNLGFKYVTVDLQGYRSGSLNEVLQIRGSEVRGQGQ